MHDLLRRCAKGVIGFQGAALLAFGVFGFCYTPGVVAFWTQLPEIWLLVSIVPEPLTRAMVGTTGSGCHEGISFIGALALFAADTVVLLAAVSAATILVRGSVTVTRAILRELADLGILLLGGFKPLARAAFRQGLLASQRELPE